MTTLPARLPEAHGALTGPTPAKTPYELAAMMRAAGLEPVVLEKTAAWLSSERRQSPATQRGYIHDLSWWLTYARRRGIDPAGAGPDDADMYAAALRGAGLADATRARRIASVSSWLQYLERTGAVTRNPFGRGMDRPKVSSVSKTRGLSEDEMNRMLAYAGAQESTRTFAILALMLAVGCRVGMVISVQVDAIGRDRGHTVIDAVVKGGKTRRFPLPPIAVEAIERYLSERGNESGPLFVTRNGKPLNQPYIFRLVRRVAAEAGIRDADNLSPHSLRHSVATLLLDRGQPLHVVQDFLGHADPRTTRRYDRARESLDRSPAYELGAILSSGVDRYTEDYAG